MKDIVGNCVGVSAKKSVVVMAIAMFTLSVGHAAAAEVTANDREIQNVQAARSEGKFVYWCPGRAREMDAVLVRFRERYPFLKVEYWRTSGGELQQKIMTEARAKVYNFDVACTDLDVLVELKAAGLVKQYDWPNAKGWHHDYKDPEGYWAARHVVVTVIGYNNQLISSAEAPKNWDNLLDPKWKGVISMPKDADWMLQLWSAWGKERTVTYLKQLAKNKPVLGPGHTARAELVAAGATKVDVRLNLNTVFEYQKKGAPVDWVRSDPILTKGTPFFIAKHAPNPNSAMIFSDWYTSLEGQKVYHDATGHLMPHPGIRSKISDALKGFNVAPTSAQVAEYGNEASKMFTALFWK